MEALWPWTLMFRWALVSFDWLVVPFNFFFSYVIKIFILNQDLVSILLIATTYTKTKLVVVDRICRGCLLLVCSWSFVEVVCVYICIKRTVQMRLVLRRSFVNVSYEVSICNYVLHCRLLVEIFPYWLFSGYESLSTF